MKKQKNEDDGEAQRKEKKEDWRLMQGMLSSAGEDTLISCSTR